MEFSLSMALLWTSLTFYSLCYVPQILINYRIKSARGMSDWFIWCYFTDYLWMLLFVYCQPFAFPYRAMVPIEAGLMTLLLFQRFYYDGIKKSLKFTFAVLGSSLGLASILLLVPTHSQLIADIAGWMAFALFTTSQIPQIIKIIKSRSTYGFSFWFVTFTATAQFLELIGGIIEKLPAASIFMCIRGLFVYAIYVYLFNKFRSRR